MLSKTVLGTSASTVESLAILLLLPREGTTTKYFKGKDMDNYYRKSRTLGLPLSTRKMVHIFARDIGHIYTEPQ